MTTQPHQDSEKGYSLRIGKHLPKNAANLAYIYTDTPAPSKNVLVQDFTENIPENSLRLNERENIQVTVNSEGYLETPSGVLELDRPEVHITDEYSLDSRKEPLYYIYRSRHLFDIRQSPVAHAIRGKSTSATKLFEEYRVEDSERFIYMGDKIKVFRAGNKPLHNTDKYKVALEKSGEDNYTYRIILYTNFLGSKESYELHYPTLKIDGLKNVSETINPEPVFNRMTLSEMGENQKGYNIIQESNGTYKVQFPTTLEDNFLVTEENRPSHQFDYQVVFDIETRFSDKNPVAVNIGIIYINETIPNAVPTSSALKRIAYNNSFMPDYVTFSNPHSRSGYYDPSDATYWETDLNMPKEHWLDYDVIIVSGYGQKNFSSVSDSMRMYLDAGGILLLDNAGEQTTVLDTRSQSGDQTFITDITFSKTNKEEAIRSFTEKAIMHDRYYEVNEPHRIGRVSPVIEFNGSENINDWAVYLQHQNGGPALMRKTEDFIGQLIVSNMGWMLDIVYGKEDALQFFTNFLLFSLENRRFISPRFKDFVYHRDDLYESEYQDDLGKTLYVDDRSDEDSSQIVAKKIIEEHVENFARKYLPDAYKNWQNISFSIQSGDSGVYPLVNPGFESTGTNSHFEETTLDAIPGFDFVKFSGDSVMGVQTQGIARTNTRSLRVKTIDSQGFFEQEVGYLQPGRYELEVFVRSEGSAGGGVAFYRTDGSEIVGKEIKGTSSWSRVDLILNLTEPTNVVLRLGAYKENTTTDLYFDDLVLKTAAVIRMTPPASGREPLYAYAITPKQKNAQLTLFEQTHNHSDFIKKDAHVNATLVVKSFVYQWFSQEVVYKKEYGNQKSTRFDISTSDKEMVLGNIQQFLPDLRSGSEWAKKDRVYYEISLHPDESNDFINLSIYDPSIDKHFFTPQGDWVINHEDIWWNGFESTVQIRAELTTYNMLGSGRHYMLRQRDENQIRVFAPGTEDERNRWYLQIQNGSFKKTKLNVTDKESVNEVGRETFYDDYLSGEHDYQLPEYDRQAFYPRHGQRLIEDELAQYLDENLIKAQRTPLLVQEGVVEKERLISLNSISRDMAQTLSDNGDNTMLMSEDNLYDEHTIFKSNHILWNKEYLPTIYYDEWQDGSMVLLTEGFRINYKEGMVHFDETMNGTIYATYAYDNFKITRRRYANRAVKSELLSSRDNYTYQAKMNNLTIQPSPVLYEGTVSPESRIPVDSYIIDYENGSFTFFQEKRARIYADYLYYEEEELEWTDANQENGEIKLSKRISFKDEIYITYLIKENNLEYKGYYDEDKDVFVHLDLNPTAGHTFSLNQEVLGVDKVVEVSGMKLLNKEIYLYLIPHRSLYYKYTRIENNTIRHCFGKESFEQVKTVHPEALLLAIIQVRENTDLESVVVMDARRPGGGLKENIRQEDIEKRVGYTSAFWDIGSFDGLAYYKNGVNIIKIPSYVLKEEGGHFNEDDIERLVEKYIAFGNYPIVEYVYAKETPIENDIIVPVMPDLPESEIPGGQPIEEEYEMVEGEDEFPDVSDEEWEAIQELEEGERIE